MPVRHESPEKGLAGRPTPAETRRGSPGTGHRGQTALSGSLGEAFLLIGPAGHIVLANTLAKELFQEERLEGRKVGALVCNQELLGHVQ